MSRIWRYVLAADNGRAPCVADGLLTLCCCKPRIRASARVGEWVVGFMPKRYGIGQVAWAGVVGEVMPMGRYGDVHPERTDAIYRLMGLGPDGRELLEHDGGVYHAAARNIRQDMSGKNSLLFSHFWYFGGQPKQLPEHLFVLCHYYVGQASRGATPETVKALAAWLSQWPPGIHGRPRDAERAELTVDVAAALEDA